MAQAVIIEVDQAEDPARLERGGEVADDRGRGGAVVLQYEADPDEVERAIGRKRLAHVPADILDAGRVVPLAGVAMRAGEISIPSTEPPGWTSRFRW